MTEAEVDTKALEAALSATPFGKVAARAFIMQGGCNREEAAVVARSMIAEYLSTLQMQSEAVAEPAEVSTRRDRSAWPDRQAPASQADLREALPQHSDKLKAGLESAVKSIQSRPPELRGSFKSRSPQ